MGFQEKRNQGGRPVVAVDEVNLLFALEEEFQDSPAEKNKSLVIIEIIPLFGSIDILSPVILGIGEAISGIPKKVYIISPGGKLGTTNVIPKRNRKDPTKINTASIFNEFIARTNYYL